MDTVPCGTPSCTAISGAGLCVGPIMKLPSSFAVGMVPSGSSLAVTYPGVCGSRVGDGGRAPRAGGCAEETVAGGAVPAFWAIAGRAPAVRPITIAMLHRLVVIIHSSILNPSAVASPRPATSHTQFHQARESAVPLRARHRLVPVPSLPAAPGQLSRRRDRRA